MNTTPESTGPTNPRAQTAPIGPPFGPSAAEQQAAKLSPSAPAADAGVMADESPEMLTAAAVEEKPARRPRGRAFAKGGPSPNPGGRPKTPPEVKEAFKGLTASAITALGQILRNHKHPQRERAAEYVIDRVLGRPATQVTGADGQPLIPPGPAADNPIVALLARVAARRSAAVAPDAPTSLGGAPAVLDANGEAEKGTAA